MAHLTPPIATTDDTPTSHGFALLRFLMNDGEYALLSDLELRLVDAASQIIVASRDTSVLVRGQMTVIRRYVVRVQERRRITAATSATPHPTADVKGSGGHGARLAPPVPTIPPTGAAVALRF